MKKKAASNNNHFIIWNDRSTYPDNIVQDIINLAL